MEIREYTKPSFQRLLLEAMQDRELSALEKNIIACIIGSCMGGDYGPCHKPENRTIAQMLHRSERSISTAMRKILDHRSIRDLPLASMTIRDAENLGAAGVAKPRAGSSVLTYNANRN